MAIAFLNDVPSPGDTAHRDPSRGFTISKVLVPIALVALVGTAFAARLPEIWVCTFPPPARSDAAALSAAALAAAAEAFLVGHGSQECPTPEEMQRDGVLSSRSKTEDPWGTPYRIVCEPDSAIAISAGRDRTFDTSDDVKSDTP
jgi:general secretion pathway protein G